jgi:hypothetical protein
LGASVAWLHNLTNQEKMFTGQNKCASHEKELGFYGLSALKGTHIHFYHAASIDQRFVSWL